MKNLLVETDWEQVFLDYFTITHPVEDDASHDLAHFKRVSDTAKKIANENPDVDLIVLLAAAYFHDIVSLPKNDPESWMSSRLSAVEAEKILLNLDFPQDKIPYVCHAIEAHSFTAKVEPETIEARIIQDADRMESLGALGIMRTFYVSGRMERAPYDAQDLYGEHRQLDDKRFGLDHFYCKLFKLPDLLQTREGAQLARKRAEFLHLFVKQLEHDVKEGDGGAHFIAWACYRAGEQGLKLFDVNNPFAVDRILDEEIVTDQLIKVKDQYAPFISRFLKELKDELCTQ